MITTWKGGKGIKELIFDRQISNYGWAMSYLEKMQIVLWRRGIMLHPAPTCYLSAPAEQNPVGRREKKE